MKKLLSIIVPVYNKEKYLTKCIESLIKLDIDKMEFEAIFVDDLSTDSSRNILETYEKEHDFIKVINLDKNSGGPATPRNIGMTEANGKYITFLDADDWLDSMGLSKLLYQMEDNRSDIGFGQSFKHTNSSITKSARFASYKSANHLVPYEIENIFRAVGPPGKIFKKEIVEENQIAFKHMKYAEDKLFFVELISKCTNASMNPLPMYHINRFKENESLVKTTSVIEKAKINLEALQYILKLEIPEVAKRKVISRIVEVDFIRRFFYTKTFLTSMEKDIFYKIFDEVKELLNENSFDISEFIVIERFKNIFHLYDNGPKQDFIEYLKYLIDDKKQSSFIYNGTVRKRVPDKFSHLPPLVEECLPVYSGTHMIENQFFELISIYKLPNVQINSVLLSKIGDERVEREVEFKLEDNKIYIPTEDMIFDNENINLRVRYDDFKSVLVHSSFPNANLNYLQKRQNFKVELIDQKENLQIPTKDYISVLPKYIVALKNLNCYHDKNFNTAPISIIESGSKVEIQKIIKTENGTPRLQLANELIITANKKYVKALETDKIEGYITGEVEKIKVIKRCKLYATRSFSREPLKTLEVGEELLIKNVVYTNKLTPRLQTEDNEYITANLNFVEILDA